MLNEQLGTLKRVNTHTNGNSRAEKYKNWNLKSSLDGLNHFLSTAKERISEL